MKTRKNSTRRLGLVLACGMITFAVSAEAKKPVKPPPEPPSGPAYQIFAEQGGIETKSISDAGVLVGSVFYQVAGGGFQTPAVLPPQIIDGEVQYLPEDLRLLPDVDGTQQYGRCLAMNAMGLAVGYVDVWDIGDDPMRAILWLADGTAVNLGVNPAGFRSAAFDINDAGLVLVAILDENGRGANGGVVVPLDVDSNGELDTCFPDDEGDGISDL